MEKESTRVSASFTKKIYQNETTNFTIALYNVKDKETSSCHVFIGDSLPLTYGVAYDFDGAWVEDKKYGKQFSVTGFREKETKGHDDTVAYLSSSLFKGIGKKTAEHLYSKFGDKIFSILDNSPEDIKSVKGMSEKKYLQFMDSYRNNQMIARIYERLKEYDGIGVNTCKKVYNKYKTNSVSVIEEHPYYLSYIKDIGFSTCDKIARKIGFREDSFERFLAGASHVLMLNELNGNTAMDIQDFGKELYNLLKPGCPNISPNMINEMSIKAIKEGLLVYRSIKTNDTQKNYIYRKNTYKNEKSVADDILRLMDTECDLDEHELQQCFETEPIKGCKAVLDDTQKKAVYMVMKNGFSVITGGAGTGKTTTINAIIEAYEKLRNGSIELLAPTGRAARRITEVTKRKAHTIHSRLRIVTNDNGEDVVLSEDEDLEISDSLVVVDEASMIDTYICSKLLGSIKEGCNVVFVGDPGQLPSVGAGAILRDLILSNAVPVVHLTKIYRQSEGSRIIDNAVKISNGDCGINEGKDFCIYETGTGKELEDKMVELYLADVKKYGLMEVACLCPVKLYEAGTISMNTRLQKLVNPAAPGKAEIKVGARTFRQGDIVMELENHQTVMNGDVGKVKRICSENGSEAIVVSFESGIEEEYKAKDFGRLTLAYAMTVHKAQGSEYRSVITCLQDSNKRMTKRNVIYTAVTRGKRVVRFCGSTNALNRAISSDNSKERKTMLSNELAFAAGKEVRL